MAYGGGQGKIVYLPKFVASIDVDGVAFVAVVVTTAPPGPDGPVVLPFPQAPQMLLRGAARAKMERSVMRESRERNMVGLEKDGQNLESGVSLEWKVGAYPEVELLAFGPSP